LEKCINLILKTIRLHACTLGLFVLSPVLIISTIVLCFTNQGKPFFFKSVQEEERAIFQIIKFKTMNDKKNLDGSLISDAERLTAIGSFLRKTSLDEIPQLINKRRNESGWTKTFITAIFSLV
jgi:lipopolysaccharide/colanic/teichoic acid biosynthesis glycosyltransferase